MKIFILSLALGLFSLETMALSCDSTNYQDYIGNSELTSQLIEETGAGCTLTKADLREANFRGAILWKANLQGADLAGTDLQLANLKGADFKGADLKEARLYKADLQGADLQGADLQGADLAGANLGGANLENAIYDDDTDFPGIDSWFNKKNMIKMIEEK